MGILFEEALKLEHGDILYTNFAKNTDGTPQRWVVNGNVKTWKRDKHRIKVPLKHGLYAYGEITNGTYEGNQYTFHLDDFELTEEKALEVLNGKKES